MIKSKANSFEIFSKKDTYAKIFQAYYTYYTYYINYTYYTNYTHYFQVRQDLGLADHVWQDKRTLIAQSVDNLGDQFRPAMHAGWLSYIRRAYPEDAAIDAGKHMYNVTFIVPLACKDVASNQAVPPQPRLCADGKRPSQASPTCVETKRRKADCDN